MIMLNLSVNQLFHREEQLRRDIELGNKEIGQLTSELAQTESKLLRAQVIRDSRGSPLEKLRINVETNSTDICYYFLMPMSTFL